MKNVLGKYIFEIIVIFIGITASFVFDEWRTGREQDARDIEIMKSLLVELERNDQFIREIDTIYLDLNTAIQQIINTRDLPREDVADVAYALLEESSQIRLKEIASYIHGYSSSDQLKILNRNKDILRYLSYMESLLTEHEITTNSIASHASSNLWPLFYQYGLSGDILKYQKDIIDMQMPDQSEPAADLSELLSNEVFIEHLELSQLKILRLIQINQAIHMQVGNIMRELNDALGEMRE